MSSKVVAKGRKLRQNEVLDALKRDEIIEGARIGQLEFVDSLLCCALILRHCVIDSLVMKNFQFQAIVDFDDCEIVERCYLENVEFEQLTTFRRVNFKSGVRFNRVSFHKRTHFNMARFDDWSRFEECHFKDRTLFSKAHFDGGGEFLKTEFSGRRSEQAKGHQFSFNDMECQRRFHLKQCRFADATTFTGSRFSDITEFHDCQFESALRIKHAHFMRHFIGKNVTCQGEFHVNGTNCEGDMLFKQCQFASLVNFSSIYGQRNVDLQGAQFGRHSQVQIVNAHFGRLLIQRHQIESRLKSLIEQDFETARREYGILKIGFRDCNEYDQEDWAYVQEKRMERYCMPLSPAEPLKSIKRIGNYLALDLASGYGTKPLNILFTSIVMLLAFAFAYVVLGANYFEDAEVWGRGFLHPWAALVLSFRIFTNAEINSVEPRSGLAAFLVMVESFLGFFVMMILVVTYSRKVIR